MLACRQGSRAGTGAGSRVLAYTAALFARWGTGAIPTNFHVVMSRGKLKSLTFWNSIAWPRHNICWQLVGELAM